MALLRRLVWTLAAAAMTMPGMLPESDLPREKPYTSVFSATSSNSGEPFYDLVTTFYDDPHSSRAFAWEAMPEYRNMVIQYGTGESEYAYQLRAKAELYPVADAKNTEAAVDESVYNAEYITPERDMLFYRVAVKNLEPGTKYIYRIGDTEKNVWSGFYEFTTEPEKTDSFSVIAVSDPQGRTAAEYKNYTNTLNAAKNDRQDAAFIINMGDFTDNANYDDWWRYFFDASAGTKESLPLMTAIGNHENRGSGTKYYNLHFYNPQNGAGLGRWYKSAPDEDKALPIIQNLDNTVYSFDYGNAHFAVINTGTDWEPRSMEQLLKMQRLWLESDLARTTKRWKILLTHIGVYVQKPRENIVREVLGSTIDKYGVDLVLEGHDHTYMRTYQMKNEKRVSERLTGLWSGEGTVYSIIGSAALKRYHSKEEHPYVAVLKNIPSKTPSYTLLDFTSKQLTFTEKLIDGTVIDEFTIDKLE
ncbi:MAG: metallophosphoesterase family protein [Clostridia bacterium]|nr:metallophosphoesterase family protein [Clostridia bacterium]